MKRALLLLLVLALLLPSALAREPCDQATGYTCEPGFDCVWIGNNPTCVPDDEPLPGATCENDDDCSNRLGDGYTCDANGECQPPDLEEKPSPYLPDENTNILLAERAVRVCGKHWDVKQSIQDTGLLVENMLCDTATTTTQDTYICSVDEEGWKWFKGETDELKKEHGGIPTEAWRRMLDFPEGIPEDVRALIDDPAVKGISCTPTGPQPTVDKHSQPVGDGEYKEIITGQCAIGQCYQADQDGISGSCKFPDETTGQYRCVLEDDEAFWLSDVSRLAQAMLEDGVQSGRHILHCAKPSVSLNEYFADEEAKAFCELIKLTSSGKADAVTVGVLYEDEPSEGALISLAGQIDLLKESDGFTEDDFYNPDIDYVRYDAEQHIAYFSTEDIAGRNIFSGFVDTIKNFLRSAQEYLGRPAQDVKLTTTIGEQIFMYIVGEVVDEHSVEYQDEPCQGRDRRVIVSNLPNTPAYTKCYTTDAWKKIIQDRGAFS